MAAPTLMLPPFPALPGSAPEKIPVKAPGVFAPSIVNSSATSTEILPPLEGTKVPVETVPLAMMERLPALMSMVPALPVLPLLACEKIPVRPPSVVSPSIFRSPATVTETLPLLPGPKLPLEISPELTIVMLPAVTATAPPWPEAKVSPEISPNPATFMLSALTVTSPLRPDENVLSKIPPELSIDSFPDTLTSTLPLFPALFPNVKLETSPKLESVIALVMTVTSPALPEPPVVEAMPSSVELL